MENPRMSSNGSYLCSNDSSTNDDTTGIILETFCHQVGGRSLILTYDHETVCKPLVPQERQYYLDLPESLRPFTPQYKGVIKVHVQVTDNEKIQLVAKTKRCSDADVNHNVDQTDDDDSMDDEDSEEKDDISSNKTMKKSQKKADGAINPWTFYCHGLHFKTLKENKNGKPIDFILMEDVVSSYKFPCIMDLKMGDKMHKDYSTLEKYNKQAAKWNASTSKTLGLRIAGIQVYEDKSKKYTYQDKYYGFQLTAQSIKDEFFRFLHNGKHLRRNVVAAFIKKLQQLYICIKEQKDSRFFSSSLLLIYEGLEEDSSSEGHLNGVYTEYEDYSAKKPENDKASAEEMQPTNGLASDIDEDVKSSLAPDNHTKQQISSENETQTHDEIYMNMNSESSTENVRVKMIDFARSFLVRPKKTVHSCEDGFDGPDEGYLLGLNSLINLLKEILMQN